MCSAIGGNALFTKLEQVAVLGVTIIITTPTRENLKK